MPKCPHVHYNIVEGLYPCNTLFRRQVGLDMLLKCCKNLHFNKIQVTAQLFTLLVHFFVHRN